VICITGVVAFKEEMGFPKLMIAALGGGSGKTILSMGLIAALRERGRAIAPYKKGPDYIDAGWLALAAGRPCYNLDPYLMDPQIMAGSFLSHTRPDDTAVVEANRGLFDGIDIEGSTSSSELAKYLNLPVLLCLDCTKTTRTMAAVVLGCRTFDPDVNIGGVVLNRVAGSRHEASLTKNIEYHTDVPVLGAIPKLGEAHFPERHMGLVPAPEHAWARESLSAVSKMAGDYLDLEAIAKMADGVSSRGPVAPSDVTSQIDTSSSLAGREKPRIGIVRDAAFQFYYPENIEALALAGAETVFVSPLSQQALPEVDALYIGGGFPETHARQLTENSRFREELKALVEDGLPVYAECGGLMYLGNSLALDGETYPMCDVLPIVFGLHERPRGHGYTRVTVSAENPYYSVGTELKGHEFHYSYLKELTGGELRLAFSMRRGDGLRDGMDGACYKNVLATYTHIHALGTPEWAPTLVENAMRYQQRKVPGE
jgi:cobyrinic acid a,c-diamide synthase